MITFRNATEDELAEVLEWAAAEGWNPGLDDAAAFFAADPGGFFVAEMGGSLIAAISVVNHDESFAFLGLYIAVPEHRGKGIGLRLWQHALEHAGSRTVGLDGVAEQQDNYRTSGFSYAGDTTRYTGHVRPQVGLGIRLAQASDISRLTDAEHAASGYRKCDYLAAWFTNTPLRKTLILPRDDGSVACCTVRKCRVGAKIGPLIANSQQEAESLLRHAATVFDGEMMVDVPDVSPELEKLCRTLNLSPGFQTARMYRGTHYSAHPAFFAVASLELG